MKKIYQGLIIEDIDDFCGKALFLKGNNNPLAEMIRDDLYKYGSYVSAKYFISKTKKNIDQLNEDLIRNISGDLYALYADVYSDYTGYLYTDEEINIGGHDLFTELIDKIGKYLYLEIEYYSNPT